VHTVVSLAILVRPSQLTIDDERLTSINLWRRVRFDFCECGEFRTWKNPAARSQSLVVFEWNGVRHRQLAR
jgi:hypothetical protein